MFFYNLYIVEIDLNAITLYLDRYLTKMKYFLTLIAALLISCTAIWAQGQAVQNRPYTDLRPIHFGVLVGTHLQDIEFNNIGPQTITAPDGTTSQVLITTDQDRWDPGFTVGVLGEFRLNTYFQFRLAPSMYFGNRHIVFHNYTQPLDNGHPTEQRQDLKTAYFATDLSLIVAAPRNNNHRPYLTFGFLPMTNLSSKSNDYLKLKHFDILAQVGIGCDFYLPYFKLRPELKFMYGLTNSLDGKHYTQLQDTAMHPYSKSVDKSRSKIIALTFYFE